MTKRQSGFFKTLAAWIVAFTLFGLLGGFAAAQSGYGPAVDQWSPTVVDACGGYGDCYNRIMWLINCESGGNPGAVSYNINPGTGMHDYGLLQISPIWGDIAYAGGVEQIYWTAAHLGTVWWAC